MQVLTHCLNNFLRVGKLIIFYPLTFLAWVLSEMLPLPLDRAYIKYWVPADLIGYIRKAVAISNTLYYLLISYLNRSSGSSQDICRITKKLIKGSKIKKVLKFSTF